MKGDSIKMTLNTDPELEVAMDDKVEAMDFDIVSSSASELEHGDISSLVMPLPVLSPVHSPASDDDVTPVTRRSSMRSTTSNASVKSLRRSGSSVKTGSLQKQNTKTMEELSMNSIGLRSKSSIARSLFGDTKTSMSNGGLLKKTTLTSQRSSSRITKDKSLPNSMNLSQELAIGPELTSSASDSSSAKACTTVDTAEPNGDVNIGDAMQTEDMAAPCETTLSTSPVGAPIPAMVGPPPIEIAISFDTTGSMSQCIEQVQAQVREIIQRLFMDIPNLKIAVIAHGDYCDAEHFYVTQKVDLTNDVPTLCSFVKDVGGTGGGDWEECYELVLQMVRTELSWTPGSQRALVMIGDAVPHPVGLQSRNIDWQQEADRLFHEMGVRVYGVQCLSEDKATPFWSDLAKRTYGRHLRLEQFNTIVDTLMAIVYREHGAEYFEAYEKEVRCREGHAMRTELSNLFENLRDRAATSTPAKPKKGRATSTAMKNRKVPPTPRTKPVAAVSKKRPTAKRVMNVASKVVKNRAKVSQIKKTSMKRSTKQLRETTSVHKFALSQLKWSPWKAGMAGNIPTKGKGWINQRSDFVGYRNGDLFREKTNRSALYEFAVQPLPGGRLYTVYFRVSNGIPAGCRWDRHLLNSKVVVNQIIRAVCNPATLYVRRAFIPKKIRVEGQLLQGTSDVRRFLSKRYDYAWISRRQQGTRGRNVKRSKHFVSAAIVQSK